MRLLPVLAAAVVLSVPVSTFAQTYTPQQILIDAGPGANTTDLLRIANLPAGQPVTKQQIEAALQRLADTGMFTNLSYTVSSIALSFKLTPLEDNNAMPVRYANFVWWDAKELEHLVEGRVPGFHGELQLHSAMTNDVMHALEVLTKEKGIPAQISAVSDPAHQVVVLRIDSPRVLFGDLKPSEEFHAAMGGSTASLEHGLKGSEFSSLDTPETIVNDLKKIFSSGGYLDVTINPPVFSAPRASGANYFVDGSAAIHRGEQYRVSSVTFDGAPAGMEGALRNEANVKSGGPASPSAADLSNADLEGRLAQFGYLDAQSSVATANNPPAHSVAYTFRINPGPLYHLSGIDASKATPDIQTALAKDSRLKPGVVLDQSVSDAISEDIHKYDPQKKQRLVTRIHREEKDTANIVLNPVALPPVH